MKTPGHCEQSDVLEWINIFTNVEHSTIHPSLIHFHPTSSIFFDQLQCYEF